MTHVLQPGDPQYTAYDPAASSGCYSIGSVMRMTPGPFWMVWSENGGAPTVKHPTREEAEAEATRLCKKHRGRKFYVLQSMGEHEEVVVQTAVVITQHATPGDSQP